MIFQHDLKFVQNCSFLVSIPVVGFNEPVISVIMIVVKSVIIVAISVITCISDIIVVLSYYCCFHNYF